MTKLLFFTLSALLALNTAASAISTFSLIWQDTGTSTIGVSTSVQQTIVADVVLQLAAGDEARGIFVSFLWDEDFADELEFVDLVEAFGVDVGSATLWGPIAPGHGSGSHDKQESTGSLSGHWTGFEAVPDIFSVPGDFAIGPMTATLGSVIFRTNPANVTTDGGDVRVGLRDNGIDAYTLAGGGHCTETFGGCTFGLPYAEVNVPEATTGMLVGAGVALAGRASRRRRFARS
jgi:hypothetical protein